MGDRRVQRRGAGGAAGSRRALPRRDRPRRNQNASTGTIVIDTSSEAPSAIAIVIANGRKSSPTTPETIATGKNTATVVRVEAVTAPATSFTDATMSLGVSV